MKRVFVLSFLIFLAAAAAAAPPPVRIKDIARVLEARDNQLMGFGLAVGLRNTGDTSQTGFTRQALTNLLSRLGIAPTQVQANEFRSRNVAAVMVTAALPPYAKPGQKIDVTVSSLGDATSLVGGTLLLTPLVGADEEIYAVAQGPLSVGSPRDTAYVSLLEKPPNTVGRIPEGALVEKEVKVTLGDKSLTIVLNNPDFTTASRVAYSISRGGLRAVAQDAASVSVAIARGEDPVTVLSRLENLTVVPDLTAKVVINERTGTIVIGENVRLAPVAVSFGNVSIKVGGVETYASNIASGPETLAPGGGTTWSTTQSRLDLDERGVRLTEVSGVTNLGTLIRALNAVGASPRDLINILQTIKAAGALSAALEII